MFHDMRPCGPVEVHLYLLPLSGSESEQHRQPACWLASSFLLVACFTYFSTLKMKQYITLKYQWTSTGLHTRTRSGRECSSVTTASENPKSNILPCIWATIYRVSTGNQIAHLYTQLRQEFSLLFSTPSRPAPGFTQPPIQWVLGTRSPTEKRGRGVKLTTHLQLVLRSRKCGSIHQLPHMPLWRSA
jgi:hypothetical protein